MQHVKDNKWECSAEGSCCELFSEFALGTKVCPMLMEDKSCGCYENRPKVCRVSGIEIEGLDMNEYLISRCHFIHKLKEWFDDVDDDKSRAWILEKIAKSGIL